ncbi:undecaprenyl-phosphate galactose phosphotransferase WbaP [bacterium]|nr:undecaprenyl-phosphate galactose phosphotransferase WbaP [bacterium]
MKKKIAAVILLLTDIGIIYIMLSSAMYIRKHILTLFFQFPEFPPINVFFFWWVFPVWLFFFAYEGLYSRRFSYWDEIKVLWKSAFFSTLAMFSILFLGKTGEHVSRTVLVTMALISLPILPVIRLNMKKFLIRTGLLSSKVLILGAGKTGKLILSAFKKDTNLGLKVVGFIDDDPEKIGGEVDGIKVHGGVDKAHKYIGRCGIEDVVIAMPGCETVRTLELINKLQHKARKILLIPDLFGITVLGTNLQHFFQEQAIGLEVRNNLARPLNVFTKRVFDWVMSMLLLFVMLLPMLVIALMIKLTSKGPVIYSQLRSGKKGRPFKCYKFRTMYNDAEQRLTDLLGSDKQAQVEWERTWKLSKDPRITWVGRLLRETSLDELPQIFNILRGEMSLVGPRPVTQDEIDEYYREQAALCFGVPPGLTGLWQVSGRSNTSYAYRIALDSWYVRNWNLWLDIVILFKTIRAVLKREGAV